MAANGTFCYTFGVKENMNSMQDSKLSGGTSGEFREIAANGTSEEIRLASQKREFAEWRRTNRFCGCCGAEMKPHANAAERAFVCPSCGYASYPRITPAVIALVTKGDKGRRVVACGRLR